MKQEIVSTGALLETWKPFRDVIGFSSINTDKEYRRAHAMIDHLLDEIGEDENHPLAEILEYLSNLVLAYEAAHVELPDASPSDVLHFLMEQNGLSQSDLSDVAPQSRISEILNGRRDISKDMAKALARKFAVNVSVFI